MQIPELVSTIDAAVETYPYSRPLRNYQVTVHRHQAMQPHMPPSAATARLAVFPADRKE
jgi:hypothetical protein